MSQESSAGYFPVYLKSFLVGGISLPIVFVAAVIVSQFLPDNSLPPEVQARAAEASRAAAAAASGILEKDDQRYFIANGLKDSAQSFATLGVLSGLVGLVPFHPYFRAMFAGVAGGTLVIGGALYGLGALIS